ncbi:hypothetical protein B0T13DRAFT_451315 [Neurospora crassa]|nr:hypothetical protein B0T13DRAFT_451315 [Neurospora crassa]
MSCPLGAFLTADVRPGVIHPLSVLAAIQLSDRWFHYCQLLTASEMGQLHAEGSTWPSTPGPLVNFLSSHGSPPLRTQPTDQVRVGTCIQRKHFHLQPGRGIASHRIDGGYTFSQALPTQGNPTLEDRFSPEIAKWTHPDINMPPRQHYPRSSPNPSAPSSHCFIPGSRFFVSVVRRLPLASAQDYQSKGPGCYTSYIRSSWASATPTATHSPLPIPLADLVR